MNAAAIARTITAPPVGWLIRPRIRRPAAAATRYSRCGIACRKLRAGRSSVAVRVFDHCASKGRSPEDVCNFCNIAECYVSNEDAIALDHCDSFSRLALRGRMESPPGKVGAKFFHDYMVTRVFPGQLAGAPSDLDH